MSFDSTIMFFFCRETSAIWIFVDVLSTQPPGQYDGEFRVTATKADAE